MADIYVNPLTVTVPIWVWVSSRFATERTLASDWLDVKNYKWLLNRVCHGNTLKSVQSV